MESLEDSIIEVIFNKIDLKTAVHYIPYGDGEQNYTIFYKNYYPYHLVNQLWYSLSNKTTKS